MIYIITGTVLAASVIIGATMMSKIKSGSSGKVDAGKIIEEYGIIKEGYKALKEAENRIVDDLQDLSPYIEKGSTINWKMYTISEDEKYLVVKGIDPLNGKQIVDTIGGTSFLEGKYAFLSFFSMKKLSKTQPIAMLRVFPEKDVLTTSNMEYSAADSIVDDGEIKEMRWENNQPIFSKSGEYTIKLKVEDKNENWSEWVSKIVTVTEKKGVRRIVAGQNKFITIMNNGHVLTFGDNDYGEMGDGTNSKIEEITYNSRIDNIAEAAFGVDFSIVKSFNGLVYCAGRNGFGQLGAGNRHNSKLYKKVWGIQGIIQIGAGDEFASALSAGGEVFMWGNNEDGQLGKTGEMKYSESPEIVEGLGAVKQIAVGATHMLALLYDGTVMAWGDNRYGQLGLGYTGKSTNIPTQTELKGVKSIYAGRGYSLAVTEGNRVISWGQNNRNQLGFIGEKEVLFPKEITGLKNIIKIAMGAKFVVALDNLGKLYTWGQYKATDKSYFEKPHQIEGLPYILDVSANHKYGYGVSGDYNIVRWSSDVNNHETFEIKENYQETTEIGEKS